MPVSAGHTRCLAPPRGAGQGHWGQPVGVKNGHLVASRHRAFEHVDLDVLIEARKLAGSRGSRSGGGGERPISATELQRGFIDAMVRAGEEGTDPGPVSYTR